MKHVNEIEVSVKVDIRQSADLEGKGEPSFDWILQGGTEESSNYFDTAEEAEADARRWLPWRMTR